MKDYDRQHVYDSPEPYFAHGRPPSMKLSAQAAQDVCRGLTARGLLVLSVEGGIKHENGTFEARLDCIWDGDPKARGMEATRNNNTLAEQFIRAKSGSNNAFIVTSGPSAP